MTTIKNSKDCMKSELDLFHTLPTNTSILRSNITVYPTTQPLNGDEDSITISIPANEEFADLNDLFLRLEVKIDKITSANKKVAPINNLGDSMWKNVECWLGTSLKSILIESSNNYSYKSYFLNLLNFDSLSKETWMELGMWIRDKAGEYDKSDLFNDISSGEGFKARKKYFTDGKDHATFIVPLRLDFLNTNRLLINRLGMTFTFKRNDSQFLLMGEDSKDFKIEIKKANILARRCTINPSITVGIQNALSVSTIKYPIKQNKIYTMPIESGMTEFTPPSFSTVIPNKVIIGLVNDEAFNGDQNNPFNFQHFDISKCIINVDSQEHVIKLRTDKNDFAEGYHAVFQSLDFYNQGTNSITLNDYKNGCALFVFNLNPDKGCQEQFNALRTGSVVIKLEFRVGTPKRLRLVCLMEYDNQLNIDKDGEIYYDYIVS